MVTVFYPSVLELVEAKECSKESFMHEDSISGLYRGSTCIHVQEAYWTALHTWMKMSILSNSR